jgi:hypothetical protein
MALQSTLVFLLVTGCFVYAAWSLLPQAALRPLSKGLLRLPLPGAWRLFLQNTLSSAGGCHCSGCDHAQPKAGGTKEPASQVLVFHPRKRR